MKSLTVPIYDLTGQTNGSLELEPSVFGVPVNHNLLQQAVVHFLANRRNAIAHTKDRSAVRGGGKKPWRQKGTGNARAGSSRSPIWRGGGITFGPTNERNFAKRLPQTMRRGALKSALSSKVADEQLLVLTSLESLDGKTKSWVKTVASLPHADERMLIVTATKHDLADRSIRNSAKHHYVSLDELTIYDILRFPILVMTKEAIEAITTRLANKKTATPLEVMAPAVATEVKV